jgi:CRISPR/Cas system-associated endonuclease Cas1
MLKGSGARPRPQPVLSLFNLSTRRPVGSNVLFPPRVHGLPVIIMSGYGASISSESCRWLAREAVACYIMSRSGECIAVLTSAVQTDCRQWKAASDPRRSLEIARKIVAAKLGTLHLAPANAREFRAEIATAVALSDLMVAEARSAAAYHMRFRGSEIVFKDQVPDHWRVFSARAASKLKGRGGVSRARNAATPWGSALNYGLAVGLGQCTRALIGLGCDPRLGFLHAARKPGRLSGSYDLLELHRAAITEIAFGWLGSRRFARADFELTTVGIVRLGPAAARNLVLDLSVDGAKICGVVLNEPVYSGIIYSASIKVHVP